MECFNIEKKGGRDERNCHGEGHDAYACTGYGFIVASFSDTAEIFGSVVVQGFVFVGSVCCFYNALAVQES
ncbi:hypothetical protein [Mariprofundus ferrooxydans]|uniref:hypothetical protein n=1 Tax=Mariprofundus ferrooxydans TaxID=314344 RepID=UPI0003AA7419|nr:hypothetical protein [Mariprofundus ferrooxydans]